MTVDVVTGEVLPVPLRRDTFGILADAIRLAEVVASTELVPPPLRNRVDAVVAVVLTGHEVGLGPMQSLQSIDMIQGQPALSAEAMRALVLSHGHGLIVEATDKAATVRCHRREWIPELWVAFRFDMADADRANLLGRGPWVTYPRAMLLARATSEACRATFADVLAGVSYTPEELGAPLAYAPPCEGDDDTAATGEIPPPLVPGTDVLEARLLAAPEAVRDAFKTWRYGAKLSWPPANGDVLAYMSDKLEALEAEAAAEAEYGDGHREHNAQP